MCNWCRLPAAASSRMIFLFSFSIAVFFFNSFYFLQHVYTLVLYNFILFYFSSLNNVYASYTADNNFQFYSYVKWMNEEKKMGGKTIADIHTHLHQSTERNYTLFAFVKCISCLVLRRLTQFWRSSLIKDLYCERPHSSSKCLPENTCRGCNTYEVYTSPQLFQFRKLRLWCWFANNKR